MEKWSRELAFTESFSHRSLVAAEEFVLLKADVNIEEISKMFLK